MIRRHFYGWYKDGAFYLSKLPADAPVRPSARIETADEIRALLTQRKGVSIDWWPPLPEDVRAEIKEGVRMDGGGEILRVAHAKR